MPKIYVAIINDGDAKHMASGSYTTMKERLRAFPETQWTIKTLQVQPGVPSLCSLIEDWTKAEVVEEEQVRILPSGQVRGVKQQ